MTVHDILHETLVLWPAWGVIVEHVSRDRPADADPQSVYGAACGCELDRLAALLYGNGLGDTLEDADGILDRLLSLAREGRRPRFGAELGFTRELFEGHGA